MATASKSSASRDRRTASKPAESVTVTDRSDGSALRIAVGGLLALASALGIGRFVYTPILPVMAAALHLSKSQAGLIASANFLGYLVGAMAATSTLFGQARRFWLIVGLMTNAAALLAMATTTDLVIFAAIRFIAGLASGFAMVFGSALVMERLAAAKRGGLSSVYFMGPGIGITFSAALVATLVAVGASWIGLWLANGIVCCVVLGVVVWAVPADDAPAGSTQTATPAGRLSRQVVLLSAAYGLVGFGYVITSTFIVAQVRETPSIATLEPYVWVLVGAAAIPSAGAWAYVATRLGAMRAFAIAAIAEAIGVAASVVSPTTPSIALAAILLGGTFVGLTALGLVAVRGMMAGDSRRGIGILTAVFGVGQIIGPLVAGTLHDLTGSFAEVTYLAAASLVVSAGLALAADRPANPDKRFAS